MSEARVIVYTRVSTNEQAVSGLGLTAQERACFDECARRGWTVVDVIRDEGQSAGSLDRPGVQDVLQRLADGDADGLVVAKLDRLTRRLADLVELVEWAGRANVFLAALDLGLDTSTSSGRLVAQVMGAVAEWERGVIGDRTRAAAAVRRDRGEQMGRPGVRDTNPELAQKIAGMRHDGLTWQSIADTLNDERVPTVRGGAQWRVSSVQAAAGYRRPPKTAARVTLPTLPRRRRRNAYSEPS